MSSRRTTDGAAEGAGSVSPGISPPEVPVTASRVDASESAGESAGESGAVSQSTAWDPYEVWLTRVKEPRDRRARATPRVPLTPPSQDTSDTGQFRALSPAPQR